MKQPTRPAAQGSGVDAIAWAAQGHPALQLVDEAQVASFARQTPLNAAVTLSVSMLLAVILWPVAPTQGLLVWIAAHQAVGWFGVWRHFASVRRQRSRVRVPGVHPPRDMARSRRRALVSGVTAGLAWGSTALFLPVIPPVQQMAVMIVIAAMAGGASTTLAAMPSAAIAYLLCALLPFTVYFATQQQIEYVGLAALSLVMTSAMVVASRIVYAMVRAELRSRERSLRLLEELRAAQHAWLDISRATEAFALFDADGKLRLWNDNLVRYLSLPEDALLTGMTHTQLIAMSAGSSVTRAQGELDYERSLLALADHPDRTLVVELANGRWLRSIARRTEEGSVVLVHVDISELKHAEAALQARETELREAQKLEAIGKLAGGVAHDFNNILTVIQGYAQLLQMPRTAPAQVEEAAAQISAAATRAATLTRQMLAFSRKQQLLPETLQLNSIVAASAQLLQKVLPSGVVLHTQLRCVDSRVNVDRLQLEQVLLNLSLNARDAMPAGGQLIFRTEDGPEETVRLAVIDDGAGMDAETIERAFEPFFTTKPVGQGSGLGLASVYGFVMQSAGTVVLHSAPGRGCTVDILLPRAHTASSST